MRKLLRDLWRLTYTRVQKHAEHAEGISLVPSTTESGAWKRWVWTHAQAILLLHGRTRFCNPDGSVTTGRPLRPVALVAWSRFDAEVLQECKIAGVLLKGWHQR